MENTGREEMRKADWRPPHKPQAISLGGTEIRCENCGAICVAMGPCRTDIDVMVEDVDPTQQL